VDADLLGLTPRKLKPLETLLVGLKSYRSNPWIGKHPGFYGMLNLESLNQC
jgi:hypothetical protein